MKDTITQSRTLQNVDTHDTHNINYTSTIIIFIYTNQNTFLAS